MDFGNFFQPALWIKIVTLLLIGFYIIFTLIVFNQTRVMAQILSLPHAQGVIKIISIIHTILAISLFGLALVIL